MTDTKIWQKRVGKFDLDADIWLSEKVQNALVSDYKDISDRYDKQLILDDTLMQSLIKQAVDKAISLIMIQTNTTDI